MIPDSVPHKNELEQAGITALEQIPRSKAELVALPGIGSAKADQILAALASLADATEPDLDIDENPERGTVRVRLAKNASVGRIVFGRTVIERNRTATISATDFERLAATYGLELAD